MSVERRSQSMPPPSRRDHNSSEQLNFDRRSNLGARSVSQENLPNVSNTANTLSAGVLLTSSNDHSRSPSRSVVDTNDDEIRGRRRTRSESRSDSRSVNTSDDDSRSPSRVNRERYKPRNDGVTDGTAFDATLRPGAVTPTSTGQDGPKLEINLKRVGSSSDTTIKAYHMVEWNGKKYRLTQVHNDGTRMIQIGFTESDWEKIANTQKALWEEAKARTPAFDFSNSSFNNDTGVWKFREAAGRPVQTIDLNNPSSTTSTYETLRPTIVKAQEVFTQKKVKPRPLKFTHGNDPKPTLASRKKPDHKPPTTLPNSLNPPRPPPEEIPWYRFDKKIINLFAKPPEPDPT